MALGWIIAATSISTYGLVIGKIIKFLFFQPKDDLTEYELSLEANSPRYELIQVNTISPVTTITKKTKNAETAFKGEKILW